MPRTIRYLVLLVCIPAAVICQAQAPVRNADTRNMSVEERLDRLERILQSQGLLDMMQQLQELQREISSLRGEIETQNYNLEQLTRRQRDLYTDVDQRLQRMESGGMPEDATNPYTGETGAEEEPPLETLSAIPAFGENGPANRPDSALQVEIVDSGETTPPPEQPADGNETVPEGPADTTPGQTAAVEVNPVTAAQVAPVDPVQLQAEYQQAFNLLRQSRYDQAIRAFQEFLAAHPNDKYSDNAQYWLAEAHYVKREFDQALTEYRKVVDNFPRSQKVNDALLKIGFTLYELGEMEPAKKQLQELIDKQPGTTVARLADERLKMINSATPGQPPAAN